MFGGKQKSPGLRGRHATVIADGTEVVGEVRFATSIDVEGVVRGNLVASEADGDAQVRVQAGGEVLGDIFAPTVVINGKVEGNIYSSKRIELAASAEVYGDVHYRIIEMVKGSQVNGSLLYAPQEEPGLAHNRPSDAVYKGLERGGEESSGGASGAGAMANADSVDA